MVENDDSIHIDAERARAGATPHMTRYVLGFGLVLVIIAFAVILENAGYGGATAAAAAGQMVTAAASLGLVR